MGKKPAFRFHLIEIQRRFLYLLLCFLSTLLTCYCYSLELVYLFVKPFLSYEKPFIFTDLTGALYTLLKVSALTAVFLLLPVLFYHLWCFFMPSCYFTERRRFTLFLLSFLLLALWSICFASFFALPKICGFLLDFEIKGDQLSLELQPRIDSYISWSFRIFSFLLCFWELPLLFLLLFELNLLTGTIFSKGRRHVFCFSLLSSAFLSPQTFSANG